MQTYLLRKNHLQIGKLMSEKEEILNTGTLYWFKSQRRGKVSVPLHYLTDEQKETLRSGLMSNRYKLCNPYHSFKVHYMWVGNDNPRHFLVTDIEISSAIKRKISPSKAIHKKTPYRLTLSDIKRLLDDFKCGKVDEIYAKNFLSDKPWRPWEEKEWKSKRDTIIQKSCKYCGSKEKLVLQHTKQPRKINSILYDLIGEQYEKLQLYIEQNINSIELPFHENVSKVLVCPKCGSSRVHFRIRGENKGTYICNKSSNKVICKHKFVTPNYGYAERDIQQAQKRRKAILRDKFCEKEGLLRIAIEISLEEIITYLNFDHTITLCNKCAYIEDRPFDKFY